MASHSSSYFWIVTQVASILPYLPTLYEINFHSWIRHFCLYSWQVKCIWFTHLTINKYIHQSTCISQHPCINQHASINMHAFTNQHACMHQSVNMHTSVIMHSSINQHWVIGVNYWSYNRSAASMNGEYLTVKYYVILLQEVNPAK